jgi:hypothetical protein
MKAQYSQEKRDKIRELNRGKSLSYEIIEKMRQSSLNRKKSVYSEEVLFNMKNKSKGLLVLNLDNTVYGKYFSIVEAAKSL